MGYTVVHSTSHGAAEEGKDVIALDTEGDPVAFQLKQGNLSLIGWRDIEPQIVELVEQPIDHPSVQTDGGTGLFSLPTARYMRKWPGESEVGITAGDRSFKHSLHGQAASCWVIFLNTRGSSCHRRFPTFTDSCL